MLEIRKKSRLSLWQMPDNLTPEFGCPAEGLVVRIIKVLYVFWLKSLFLGHKTIHLFYNSKRCETAHPKQICRIHLKEMNTTLSLTFNVNEILLCTFRSGIVILKLPSHAKHTKLKTAKYKLFPDNSQTRYVSDYTWVTNLFA